ncbi:MAG TPA: MBL fold metallo-hydrolase [Gaiellaceae bacterium]|nr:MBL fold metallo-hydrolase [Gaiellaceae bacterium]
MRTLAVTGFVTQLTRFRFVNCFLVREDDGLTLVDTTMNAADGIVAAAERIDAPIVRIALTHGHGDHVGSLDALKQRLGDSVQVLMPEADAQIHAGERAKTKGSWPKLSTVPDVRLRGGERIGSLEVVPSPGHTPGHVSFVDTRDRTLIAGDVFTSYGRVEVSNHFYWRFPFAAMATEDGAQDVESARALRALDPSLLLVGHGPAARRPVEAMERAIARAARS